MISICVFNRATTSINANLNAMGSKDWRRVYVGFSAYLVFVRPNFPPSFLRLAPTLVPCRKKSFGSPVDPKSCLGELIKGKTFLHGRDRSGNAVLYHFVRNQDPNTRGNGNGKELKVGYSS